jgi:hypothetical protein
MKNDLRCFLCEYFKERETLGIESEPSLLDTIKSFAGSRGIQNPMQKGASYHEVISELWNMTMERILELKWSGGSISGVQGFNCTEYGRQLLEGPPIDRPNEYIDHLKKQVPKIDEQVIVYVRESLTAFNRDCCFASAVMLGVASERLFELLLDAYANAMHDQKKQTRFRQKIAGRGVRTQYTLFLTKLCDLTGKNGITDKDPSSTTRLRQDLKHAVKITFESIRSYRDYAAHPRNGVVPRHIIRDHLAGFPLFCQRLYQAIEWLKNNKI